MPWVPSRRWVSLADACREVEIPVNTVRHWLKRGRREENGPYAMFAREIDNARAFELPSGPMTRDELRLIVWRAVQKGSVPAMRLYWQILEAERHPAKRDPLSGVDELAARRTKAARSDSA